MRKTPLRAAITAIALVAALALAGCAPGNAGGDGDGAASAVTVGFVQPHADTFFGNIEKGIQQGLGDGGTVTSVNFNHDGAKEAQAYDDFISRGVDVIVTSPLDPTGSVAGIRNASQAGIPVVCVNTCINEEDAAKYVTAFVLSDNAKLGTLTGERAAAFIDDRLGGTARIGMLNCDLYDICKIRKTAFLEALDDAGVDYEVVADQEGFEPDAAVPVAAAMLTAHPDINLFWTANDGGALGAIKAIKTAGKVGESFVFGTDVSDAMVAALLSDDDILQSFTGQDGILNGETVAEIAKQAAADPDYKPSEFEVLVDVINFERSDPTTAEEWQAANG
ncbi:substrate-binding domain-containing protein [Microbacterium sp.]|uniref:substrate-binding domain-containing protein n=1 Tax=Microbacterium sp. TaxID=51671 RepID=UPI003A8E8474